MFSVDISWSFDTVVQKNFSRLFTKLFVIAVVLLLDKNLIFF